MIPDQEPPAANPTPIQPGGSGAELTWPVSARIAGRFESRAGRRRSAAIAYIATAAAYLGWRTTIIAPDSAALSWAYLVAEFLGFVLGLSTLLDSWDYRHREPPPALPDRTVDVFVPVYREPLAIIRRTLRAAAGIRYPHQTWVLDDGNRDDVRILAQSLGLRYLARPENRNAKAGNLNFGLAHSEAEFVAVFDADHVAMPHALEVMLGFFEDASVAMVQTPQDYFNTDAFQYINPRGKPGLWHDQSFFYNVVQSCRDGRNAVSCVGTGVVYRRSALRAIGGIPEETLTEDLHTSLKLHKAGWRAVHLNEPVAYGIAAADVADYYRTRYRWAHGNLAALRIERVLTCRGLDMRQRLSYLATGLIYLEGWQQLLLFAVPPCALVFGLRPFDISIFNVLVVLS
ncbi:MAG TPA: glycosyltransferase, partial [Burkholderiales bacterium]